MKRRVIRFITGAFLVTMVFADSALAAIRTWPGTAPCAGSFVDCLASAQAGDTVRIVSTATIPDQIALTLPVSIETAPGASATFTSTTAHTFTLPGSAPWTATLRGLKFVGGTLRFTLNGAQAGELRLEQLSISGNASGQQMQINFNLAQSTSARTLINIKGCDFEMGSDPGVSNSISQFGNSTGGIDFIVEDSLFRPEAVVVAQTFQRALSLSAGGNSGWDVVFRRNQVLQAATTPVRGYASGVAVNSGDNVNVNLLVHDNAFVLDDVAGGGGTAVLAGGSTGVFQVRVINNTILHAYYAAAFSPNASGRFDNNVLAFGFRMHEGSAPAASFTQRGNLIFGYPNASNWPTAPGTLTVDPLLSANGLPRTGSPVIDVGSTAARGETGPGSYGALEARDANGLRRVEGAQIDIGAFEGERLFYDGLE